MSNDDKLDDVEWLHRFLNCVPFGPPVSEIQRAHEIVSSLAAQSATTPKLPKEPPLELLISMALRVNHGFGLDDERSQEVQIADMRKVYEEVSGHGFYSEDNKVRYSGFLRRADSEAKR